MRLLRIIIAGLQGRLVVRNVGPKWFYKTKRDNSKTNNLGAR